MSEPMKIMSVLDLDPRKLGSFEEYTISLSQSLTSAGGKSILVFNNLPPESLRSLYLDAGAILETKPFVPLGRQSASLLLTLVRKYRPHVVHFHFVNLFSLDLIAVAVASRAKVFYSEHASDVSKKRSLIRWWALQARTRALSSLVDRLIAPSAYVKGRLVRQGVSEKKVAVIHNGVNLRGFGKTSGGDGIRARYGIDSGSMLVSSISQLIPEKGVPDLIDAAALAIGRGANLAFIHVGDGPFGEDYRARVRKLGIEERFIFTGLLNMPEVAAILRGSDVFTLPCTWGEAFSLVVLEALAAGKPAVVTSVGGNTEAIENGRNGLVVPPNDPGALATALVQLHDNPDRRRAMARESVARSAYFSVERWVDETINLYAQLMS